MKRIIVFFILIKISIGLFAQSDFFYTEKGGKEYFKIRKDRVILKTKGVEAKALSGQTTIFRSVRDVNYDMVIATIDTLQINLDGLRQKQGIIDVSYALEYADGTIQMPTNKIFVKFKEGQSPEKVFNYIGLNKNVESIELINENHEIHSIILNVKLGDILQICRNLFESGLCEFAEPSFIREMKPHNEYYPNQWGLKNTGQYNGTANIDIKAEQAWNITRGSADIKVAVIDEGVDLTHPDLQANLLRGYDATVNPPSGAYGSPSADDAHGTACAGIIGAINNTIGIVGVASSSKIIPVRIAYGSYGYWITNDDWIVDGIRYAWKTANADVISNSWGGGAVSATVNAEINDAVANGRVKNGVSLGCVVVFSTGNENRPSVSYPANLNSVIAVGAIAQCGQRKSQTSCDGETWWGSNYGDALDVVAPGVKIYTSDIQGTAGYNFASGTAGDYFESFNGTSSACPHVAGVAALILSVRPNLTQTQVRQAIESTCTKLSGYAYSNNTSHPYGTWNNQVGHGLINAYAAIEAICPTVNFTNRTVNSNQTVTGCNIYVQNVTVNGSAKLTLDADYMTTIERDFEVKLGTELEIR